MAKKSRRSSSRKMKHTRKHKTHRRRSHRRRGGMAPVNYHLSGSWPSRMSLGQGADYFKYHEGQHGGGALAMGKFPDAVLDTGLPAALRGPAHIGGIDKAIADVAGLKDQAGGKRRKHRKGSKRHHKGSKRHRKGSKRHHKGSKRHHKSRRHSKKHRRTHRKRGGALGYAPFPSTGMLLNSSKEYAQAGLNPEWKTDVAFTDAKIRESQ
jgi:hypothetical protein